MNIYDRKYNIKYLIRYNKLQYYLYIFDFFFNKRLFTHFVHGDKKKLKVM
jgi:hypothetical protein